MRRRMLAGLGLVVACSSGTTGGAPDTPAQAAATPGGQAPRGATTAAAPPAVLYRPGTLRYVNHGRNHAQQEVMGQTQTQDFGVTSYLSLAVTASPATPGSLKATLVVDSVIPDSGTSLPGADWNSARGLAYSGTLSPNGALTEVSGSDSAAAPFVRGLLLGLRTFLPRLPTDGLRPGMGWVDTTETKNTAGGTGEITVRAITGHETSDWIDAAGTRALEVRHSGTYTLSGTASQGGQDLSLDGAGTRQSRTLISADGRYLGGESVDSATVTVLIPSQGMVVPVVQIQRSTTKVLR